MNTSAASQRAIILQLIQSNGRMSTLDARNNGIMHPAMRVRELRQKGHNIVTNWISQMDHAGVKHRIGIYTLDGGGHAS